MMIGMMEQNYNSVLAVGHRGCRDLRLENTLSAFKHALDLGMDAIELDVHLTKDGELVVYHDYFLNPELIKTSSISGIGKSKEPIHTKMFADLKDLKLGEINHDSVYAKKHPKIEHVKDESIPMLQDVFGLIKEYPKARLLIEIKTTPLEPENSSDPELIARAVVNEINNSNMKDRCEILAFDWRVMQHVKQLDPSIPLSFNHVKQEESNSPWFAGYDLKDFQNSPSALIAHMGGKVWSAQYKQLTTDNIKQAHELGLKVYAWTVNTKYEMKKLINLGVDAIITDRPDLLIQILKR